MAWNDGLAGTALAIAATDDSPLRVMAGPGTGKSFAMKRRVARLLEGGQPPNRILAVTFTRNAAASLVKDLHALGSPGAEEVRVGTLHAFCFALLSRKDVFDVMGRIPRPLLSPSKSGVLQYEGGVMLADLVRQGNFGSKRDCTKRIRAFEAAWSRLQADAPGWPDDPIDSHFHHVLIAWLQFHEAILIGELVPEALRYLRNNPAADALSAYDHVIVDEYQDLNRAEQDLIDLLGGHGSTAIVGDLDQSIYSFRHANPEGIEQFGATHVHTHDETLAECRRCPRRVVSMADSLIRHNHPGLQQPRLIPKQDNPEGTVHIVQWGSLEEEATGIALYVEHLITELAVTPGEVLVLTPRRLLAYSVRDNIKSLGIPVHSFYHDEALDSPDAQRAFALLTLLVNPEDRVTLRWWLGHGSPSARSTAYAKLRTHCENSGATPREALEALANGTLVLKGVKDLVDKYVELQASTAPLAELGPADLINTLLPDDNQAYAVLREIAEVALPAADDAEALLEAISAHITQPEMPEAGEFVRIMSLHKSKGLTSRVVVVSGCIEGLIPFEDADATPQAQAANLQEQRRLFYVAVTRATETLLLSSSICIDRALAWKIGARVQAGQTAVAATIASRFLPELGGSAPAPKIGDAFTASGYK